MIGDEARVVAAFCEYLRAGGWTVDTEIDFVDVKATKDVRTLLAEVKGTTSSRGLDVDTMYGQLLRRMPAEDDPNVMFAVVIPEASLGAALRAHHDRGCSRGLNPPVSSKLLAM